MCLQLGSQMVGDGHYVALETVYIGEDVVVDTLEHIVGGGVAGSFNQVCVVDKTVAEGLHGVNSAFNGKLVDDVEFTFHGFICGIVRMIMQGDEDQGLVSSRGSYAPRVAEVRGAP